MLGLVDSEGVPDAVSLGDVDWLGVTEMLALCEGVSVRDGDAVCVPEAVGDRVCVRVAALDRDIVWLFVCVCELVSV